MLQKSEIKGFHSIILIKLAECRKNQSIYRNQPNHRDFDRNGSYATTFGRQWYLLMVRMLLCFRRDRSMAQMRFIIHFCCALLIGTLYINIGNDASMMFNNYRYLFLTFMLLMHTSFCSMTILCKQTDCDHYQVQSY